MRKQFGCICYVFKTPVSFYPTLFTYDLYNFCIAFRPIADAVR